MRKPSYPSDNDRNIVGKRVRELRRAHIPRITQDQLAGRLAKQGVSLDRVAIAKIESGLRCVFDYEAKAFASALDVDLPTLFEATKITGRSSSL